MPVHVPPLTPDSPDYLPPMADMGDPLALDCVQPGFRVTLRGQVWYCSRAAEHDGDHAAHYQSGDTVVMAARWPIAEVPDAV